MNDDKMTIGDIIGYIILGVLTIIGIVTILLVIASVCGLCD